MCKIICHILFYYSIMIRNKSINVLIVFSKKVLNHKTVVFLQKLFLSTNLFFLLVKLLCFRLTISSALLETPLILFVLVCGWCWLLSLNISIEGLLLRQIMWVWKRGLDHYDDAVLISAFHNVS